VENNVSISSQHRTKERAARSKNNRRHKNQDYSKLKKDKNSKSQVQGRTGTANKTNLIMTEINPSQHQHLVLVAESAASSARSNRGKDLSFQ